jgi:hypothetical protein
MLCSFCSSFSFLRYYLFCYSVILLLFSSRYYYLLLCYFSRYYYFFRYFSRYMCDKQSLLYMCFCLGGGAYLSTWSRVVGRLSRACFSLIGVSGPSFYYIFIRRDLLVYRILPRFVIKCVLSILSLKCLS